MEQTKRKSRDPQPRSILITGASSGIGAALAQAYAAEGITLFLGGRDKTRLEDVAKTCRALGATVHINIQDVLDQTGMAAWIKRADEMAPLDLVIANAGVSAGTAGENGESQKQAQMIFAVNVYGVTNTVYPALEVMRPREKGQIAIMSSLAGFYGFPGAPAYCGSKAAVRVMGEAWRAQFRAENIKINVICPGYVQTTMTDANDFHMPLLVPASRAAKIIRRGLEHNKARIAFPWLMRAMVWQIANWPASFTDWLLSRLPAKKAWEE